jgi:hypothetical protein
MAMKNIGKPNLSSNLKTGFKLMLRGVSRGAPPQRPSVAGKIASNHPIASVRSALSGRKKGRSMY